MPPKSKKRKSPGSSATATTNGDHKALSAPDRATWPGWVEMESEPAFFNTMLKDLGVCGVKVQEVYGLDDDMLAILPQPVHAFIFLFRYRETDPSDLPSECPKDVWFAEQVPDFACASVALLNIVNNIPGLEMGKELRDFQDFTRDMNPLSRGDAIDSFDFIKRIHNSFARESDLLVADMHLKEKTAKARKRQATAKARETKAAKAAAAAAALETPAKVDSKTATPTRTSGRQRKPLRRSISPSLNSPAARKALEAENKQKTTESVSNSEDKAKTTTKTQASGNMHESSTESIPDSEDEEKPATKRKASLKKQKSTESIAISDDEVKPSTKPKAGVNKPKPTEAIPNPDDTFDPTTKSKAGDTQPTNPRRSNRRPQPRIKLTNDTAPDEATKAEAEAEEEGFHFCAYLPVGDHVWKLDGMDKFPQNMGPYDPATGWVSLAQPVLQGRMAQYEAGAIEFNLMAVVHDPISAAREALLSNVKLMCDLESKLAELVEDWREMVETHPSEADLVTGPDVEFMISEADLRDSLQPDGSLAKLEAAEDLAQLLELRKEHVTQQAGLRAAYRDEIESSKSEADKAMHRRHDYGKFIREWMGALAESEVLEELIEGA